MLRKRLIIILVTFFTAVLVGCGSRNKDQAKSAPGGSNNTVVVIPTDSQEDAEEFEITDPKLKELAEGSPYELYLNSMKIATEAQLKQLVELHDKLYFGYTEDNYVREIKRIMGLIPDDTPYVTVEKANELIREMKADGTLDVFDVYVVRNRFNEIAPPDMDGGSGFAVIRYSVDAEHTGYIDIHEVMGIRFHNLVDDSWVTLYEPEY